jgi:hypothetical protein
MLEGREGGVGAWARRWGANIPRREASRAVWLVLRRLSFMQTGYMRGVGTGRGDQQRGYLDLRMAVTGSGSCWSAFLRRRAMSHIWSSERRCW